MTHRGPFQPPTFCVSVCFCSYNGMSICLLLYLCSCVSKSSRALPQTSALARSSGHQASSVAGEPVPSEPSLLWVLLLRASFPKHTEFPKEANGFLQSVGHTSLLTPVTGKPEACSEGVQPGGRFCSTLKCQCYHVHTLIKGIKKGKNNKIKKKKRAALLKDDPKVPFSCGQPRLKDLPAKLGSLAAWWV